MSGRDESGAGLMSDGGGNFLNGHNAAGNGSVAWRGKIKILVNTSLFKKIENSLIGVTNWHFLHFFHLIFITLTLVIFPVLILANNPHSF